MAYALLNRLTTKPGQRERVVELLLESGRLFDDNPSCHLYLVSESADEPDIVWVVDLWTSEAEHAAALKAPELRPFVEATVPLLEGPPHQLRCIRPGGRVCPAERLIRGTVSPNPGYGVGSTAAVTGCHAGCPSNPGASVRARVTPVSTSTT